MTEQTNRSKFWFCAAIAVKLTDVMLILEGKIEVNFSGGFKIAMKMIVFNRMMSYFKNCLSQNQKAFVTFDRQKFKIKMFISLC
jgi:hypothetical protein